MALHRRLIADALTSLGYEVRHIRDVSEAEVHRLAAPATIVDGVLTYASPDQQIDRGWNSARRSRDLVRRRYLGDIEVLCILDDAITVFLNVAGEVPSRGSIVMHAPASERDTFRRRTSRSVTLLLVAAVPLAAQASATAGATAATSAEPPAWAMPLNPPRLRRSTV